MASEKITTTILDHNGNPILSSPSLNEANTSTNIPNFEDNNFSTNTSSIFNENSSNNNIDTNTQTSNSAVEEKYTYSYQQLSAIIDQQLSGKLQNFMDENERKISEIKSNVNNHKQVVDTKVESLGSSVTNLVTNKQFGITSRIGIAAVIVSLIVVIYPDLTGKFNEINTLKQDLAVLENKLSNTNNTSDDNKKELDKISNDLQSINLKIQQLQYKK